MAEPWASRRPAEPTGRLEIEHVHAYLRADDAWGRGQAALTPAPWRAVFAYGRRDSGSAPLFAAATIAHLSYDLPLALARTGSGAQVNRAFEQLMQIYVEDGGVGGALNVQRMLRRHAEEHGYVTAEWQRQLRGQAWDDAIDLMDDDEHVRTVSFTRIELAAVCEVRRALKGLLVDL